MMKLNSEQKDQLAEVMHLDGWTVIKLLLESQISDQKELVTSARIDVSGRDIVLRKASLDGAKLVRKMLLEAEMIALKGES